MTRKTDHFSKSGLLAGHLRFMLPVALNPNYAALFSRVHFEPSEVRCQVPGFSVADAPLPDTAALMQAR